MIVEPTESLLVLLGRFSKGLRRVAVLAGDGSHRVKTVATQTDALRYVFCAPFSLPPVLPFITHNIAQQLHA